MDSINITAGDYNLTDIGSLNVLLGKNGCGKSRLLRSVEQVLIVDTTYGRCRYITPERGGVLLFESGIDQAVVNDDTWLPGQRRKNQSNNFRQQSVAQYRKLQMSVLMEIAHDKRDDKTYTLEQFMEKLNTLLDNIQLAASTAGFKIFKKGTTDEMSTDSLSSGESELISLGIECLTFSEEVEPGKENILFLDEPDVHLHPDLQVRLMNFLCELVNKREFRVIIATHSTAILGALSEEEGAQIAFMKAEQKNIRFKSVTDSYKKILPVFGAHPLSNVFNSAPILLVEGEDDERIWQQVVRSARGKIKLYPCSVEGVGDLNEYELEAREILETVYDSARGYSLRDKDDTEDGIDDLLPIIRVKLSCRNAENLLIADETLDSLSTNWADLQVGIEKWLQTNNDHPHYSVMDGFRAGGYDRKSFDLKIVRNDLMGIIGSEKPWEVVVGQSIAALTWEDATNFNENNKLVTFLGEKTVRQLIPK